MDDYYNTNGNIKDYFNVSNNDYYTDVNAPWNHYFEDIINIEFENGIAAIGTFAFEYCTKLSEITFPESIIEIDYGSFAHCTNLSTIVFKGDKPTFEYDRGLKPFEDVTATVKYPKDNSTWKDIEKNWDGGGEMTFEAYDSGSSSAVSESVTAQGECGENALLKLSEGTLYISGSGEMTNYKSPTSRSLIYYDNLSEAPWTEYSDEIKVVEIENGITSIGYCSFDDCDHLSEITIPDSVTNIGHGAFYGCDNLSTVIIPKNVNYIDQYAFAYCYHLTDITFKCDKPHFYYEGEGKTALLNSFESVTAAVKFPKNNSTWKDIEENWYGGGEMTFEAYDSDS